MLYNTFYKFFFKKYNILKFFTVYKIQPHLVYFLCYDYIFINIYIFIKNKFTTFYFFIFKPLTNKYVGLLYLINKLFSFFLSISILVLIFYVLILSSAIPFSKVLVEWLILINLFYFIISGFFFFLKKYKYSKFTSAIQRFWRRSFILFWLIEGSLFTVFIYLVFNASQEPVFMLDFMQLNKTRLFSWRFFLFKSTLLVCALILTYLILLRIKNTNFNSNILFFFVVTLLLTYIFWLEFYQFIFVVQWYGEITWVFDTDDKTWYAENVFKRTRIINNYITICIIAKFWHMVFIYIFWLLCLLKISKQKVASYVLISSNLQNFVILFIMNLLFMYPWLKFLFRKFLSKTHATFKDEHTTIIFGFFEDFIMFYSCIFFL